MVVILGIIFMIGGRHKERIEIKNLYPQMFQVIQLLPNPFQIAAIKTMYIKGLYRGIPI